jgi:hypothetical protein
MLREKERWVGFYANQHKHMGNRTSNRVEGAHSAIKSALGNNSSGKIASVTAKIDRWYCKKVNI